MIRAPFQEGSVSISFNPTYLLRRSKLLTVNKLLFVLFLLLDRLHWFPEGSEQGFKFNCASSLTRWIIPLGDFVKINLTLVWLKKRARRQIVGKLRDLVQCSLIVMHVVAVGVWFWTKIEKKRKAYKGIQSHSDWTFRYFNSSNFPF